jgi:hypothetical protein
MKSARSKLTKNSTHDKAREKSKSKAKRVTVPTSVEVTDLIGYLNRTVYQYRDDSYIVFVFIERQHTIRATRVGPARVGTVHLLISSNPLDLHSIIDQMDDNVTSGDLMSNPVYRSSLWQYVILEANRMILIGAEGYMDLRQAGSTVDGIHVSIGKEDYGVPLSLTEIGHIAGSPRSA